MSSKKRKPAGKTSRPTFEEHAVEPHAGLFSEFWDFFLTNKKWWLIPIVLMLLFVAGLVLLSGTAFAPFIYPFF